jgi:hypothetical protein
MLSALGDSSGQCAGNTPYGQQLPSHSWVARPKNRSLYHDPKLQSIVVSLPGDEHRVELGMLVLPTRVNNPPTVSKSRHWTVYSIGNSVDKQRNVWFRGSKPLLGLPKHVLETYVGWGLHQQSVVLTSNSVNKQTEMIMLLVFWAGWALRYP